jgi:hypothetical protein
VLEPHARVGGWRRRGTDHFDTMRPDLSISILYERVGEKRLGRLVVAELFGRVGEHQVNVETVVDERETLNPFNGKEQQGKTPTPPPPRPSVLMTLWLRHRYHLRHPFRDSE